MEAALACAAALRSEAADVAIYSVLLAYEIGPFAVASVLRDRPVRWTDDGESEALAILNMAKKVFRDGAQEDWHKLIVHALPWAERCLSGARFAAKVGPGVIAAVAEEKLEALRGRPNFEKAMKLFDDQKVKDGHLLDMRERAYGRVAPAEYWP